MSDPFNPDSHEVSDEYEHEDLHSEGLESEAGHPDSASSFDQESESPLGSEGSPNPHDYDDEDRAR